MKNIIYISISLLLLACEKDVVVYNSQDCDLSYSFLNDHSQKATIQNLLDQCVSDGIPGITAIVNSDTEGFFYGTSGVADLAALTSLRPCNTFRVASLTKTFIATAFMQLAEAGKIDLNAQISTILDYQVLDGLAKANETTIAELLNHTSGIPNYDDNSRFVAAVLNEPGKMLTVEDRLNFAKELKGTPDWVIEKYDQIYSNTNYVLLQLILEKVTGQSYEMYLNEYIIEPLNLERTTFSTVKAFPKGLSSGYCDMFDNGELRDVNLFDANRWSAEAGIISNAIDIYSFFNALLFARLTSSQMLDSMKNNKFGLLHETMDGTEGIGHDGQAIGYSSEMWFFPEKSLTIILIANQGRISEDQPSIRGFENALIDILKIH